MSQKPLKRNLQLIARSTISRVLDPLVKFAIDAGISVKEIEELLRGRAVQVVANKQTEKRNRLNLSGIAATTGLSRTEVAKILKGSTSESKHDKQSNQLTNRVLRAWHEDPKYIDSSRKPLTIDIFGRGVSFESLVRSYGRGIPVRALLDELIDTDAVEIIGDEMVRAKSNIAILRGLQPKMIESFGDRAAELLESMLENLRETAQPKFVGTVEARNVHPDTVALIRREVTKRGPIFLLDIERSLFANSQSPVRAQVERRGEINRASVTIYYYDDVSRRDSEHQNVRVASRRNYRRKSGSDSD